MEEDFEKAYEAKKELSKQWGNIKPISLFIAELSDIDNSWPFINRIQRDLFDEGYIHQMISSMDDCYYFEMNEHTSAKEARILFNIMKAYRDAHPDENITIREPSILSELFR